MKKRPQKQTPDLGYPTYAECRRQRPDWLRRLAVGAAVLGASSMIGCDDVRRVLGLEEEPCDVPLPGVVPVLVVPPGDDDSAEEDEETVPAIDEPATPEEEARPSGRTRGKIAMPQHGEGSET